MSNKQRRVLRREFRRLGLRIVSVRKWERVNRQQQSLVGKTGVQQQIQRTVEFWAGRS